MRIVLIILMVLGLLDAVGLGLLVGNENVLSDDAAKMMKLAEQLPEDAAPRKMAEGARMSGIGGFLVGISALITGVTVFMKKTKVIQIMAGVTTLLALIFIALSPSFEMGPNAGMDPRGQAMVYGIGAIVVALCGFGAEKMRLKKA